ncbi:hypothetical protein [Nitrincola sp. A-D6]|uniref:hypothetical protein n=1 Tax=Nitrincola sp. A-D6 TaxID=1545442 RepID=UPI00068FC5FB|nr:hypothetical protein [Nitrincola sp. A-D6]
MARRKELKNIAQGIVSSFVSRNNDYDGYWELAKLYDLSKNNSGAEISIDLLGSTIYPYLESFEPLVYIWQSKFLKMLESRSIPAKWVNSAIIHAKFDVEYREQLHKWGMSGEPCTCECAIITDNGSKYSVSAGTKCMPFSRAWFQRSTRRKNF